MRTVFTIDDFMIAFVAALGYGFGETFSKLFGWSDLACMGVSIALGMAIERIVNNIVFSEAVQKKPRNRILTYVAFVVIFLVGHLISNALTGVSMMSYLEAQLKFAVILPIAGFGINLLIRAYRIHKVRKVYGKGDNGYVFDVTQEELDELNTENHAAPENYDATLAVRTRTGTYVGEKLGGTVAYLGIPYAQPPVGDLRWKAPEPLPPSDGIFEASSLGASAIQVEHKGSTLRLHRQSEDCLSLNIFAARQEAEAKRPVLVLFHHGDFSYGGSADPLLYGNEFVSAHQDVVFVSFNYRLGILGFIDFSEVPGGEAYPDAPNLGLLDQIAALRWIKENISAFGGDPDQIAVIGFGSGATSISLLATSTQAKGLFQRAFVFSGNPEDAHDTPEASRTLARDLLRETQTATMEELSALDTETLKAAAQKLWLDMCAPTCDGRLIPTDVYASYLAGAASGIEFIVGIPGSERVSFRSLVGDQSYEAYVSRCLASMQVGADDRISRALQAFIELQAASSSELEAKSKLIELWGTLCAYRFAAKLREAGNAVHLLYWDKKPLLEHLGSGTIDVVATLLGNAEASQMYGNVMDDDLSEVLQSLLRKFVAGDALQLYTNEIKGIDALDWEAFPRALIVSDEGIRLGEFRSAELLCLIMEARR